VFSSVSEESTLFDEKSNRNQTRGNLGAISEITKMPTALFSGDWHF
jgi:hypothetical protein